MPATAKDVREQSTKVAELSRDSVRQAADSVQQVADTAQETLRSGVDAVSQTFQRSTEQFVRSFSLAGQPAEELIQQSVRNMEAAAKCGTVLTQGFQDISRQWFELAKERLQKNRETLEELARARTVQDFVNVQSRLVSDNVQHMIDNSRQIAELAVRVADEASRTMTASAKETADRVRRAA